MSKKLSVAPKSSMNRKQLSRREQEQRATQRLIVGATIVIGLIVAVLGWGLYDQYVLRPRKPVATVAGVPIRLDYYQKLYKYRYWDYKNYQARLESQLQRLDPNDQNQSFLYQYMQQQKTQLDSQIANLDQQVLNEVIEDQITRQEAAKRGITVSADEVQLELEKQFGYDRNPPTPEPTATVTATEPMTATPMPTATLMTLDEFNKLSSDWFQTAQSQAGFSEKDFRGLLEGSLYREKLTEALKAEAPTTAEQIHARHILVATKEEAEAALARLKNGEDFAALAKELSTDTSNAEEGGDLGWFPRGQMVTAFDDAAFALQPGQLSDVVETQYGFHIIRVEEREANRALEGSALEQAQSQYVDDWYNQQVASEIVVRSWDSTMVPKVN